MISLSLFLRSFTAASQILVMRCIILSISLLNKDGIGGIVAPAAVKAESFLAECGCWWFRSHLDEGTSEGMIVIICEDLLSCISQFIRSHILLYF